MCTCVCVWSVCVKCASCFSWLWEHDVLSSNPRSSEMYRQRKHGPSIGVFYICRTYVESVRLHFHTLVFLLNFNVAPCYCWSKPLLYSCLWLTLSFNPLITSIVTGLSLQSARTKHFEGLRWLFFPNHQSEVAKKEGKKWSSQPQTLILLKAQSCMCKSV